MEKRFETMLPQLRHASGKTQAQIAAEIGVSTQAYSSWETGRIELGTQRIIELARVFGVTPNEIVGFGLTPGTTFDLLDDDERELMDLFRALPPTIRDHFLAILRYSALPLPR